MGSTTTLPSAITKAEFGPGPTIETGLAAGGGGVCVGSAPGGIGVGLGRSGAMKILELNGFSLVAGIAR